MTLGRRLLGIVLFVGLLARPQPSKAADGPPVDVQFRWIEELESLSPREFPDRLSRSQPWYQEGPEVAFLSGLSVDFAHYPTSSEIIAFITELEGLYPHLVESYEISQSWQGRPIMGLRLGNEATGDPDERPALYLDGQHHAREAISQQVVLYTVWQLLADYGVDPLVTHLLNTRTVYAVPSVNVDGNDIWLADDFLQRRTTNPDASDDDVDGFFDEDPANGMGYGTHMLYRYDFEQAWADAHPDDPFVSGWEEHFLGSEYLGVFDGQGNEVPQSDDDDDGPINEDPLGGVDANRNYDAQWDLGDTDPKSPFYRGPSLWSEPGPAAVRDFVLGHEHLVTALSYHSGADMIVHPWAWSAEADLGDAVMYELLSRKGSQLTESNGFLGSPHAWAARGLYAAPGTAMDWLYSQGIYAWTPEAYGASSIVFSERMGTSGSFRVGVSVGVGFNPDPSDIPQTVQRWHRFNTYLLAATPHVLLTGLAVEGGVLGLTLANDGFIPVEIAVTVAGGGGFAASEVIPYLQAGEKLVSIGYPAGSPAQLLSVTVTSRTLTGTISKEIQQERLVLWIEEWGGVHTVVFLQGSVEDFTDLGAYFGEGRWLAPKAWDAAGIYHLGPPLLEETFLPIVDAGG